MNAESELYRVWTGEDSGLGESGGKRVCELVLTCFLDFLLLLL